MCVILEDHHTSKCRLSDLVRCKAVVAFQGVDALHLVGSKFEVEDVVILGDVGGIAGTGNGDGATLQMLAEEDLIGRFAMGLGYVGNHLVLRERLDARAATAQWEPCLEDGSKFGDVDLHAAALVVGMCLVLQHCGFDGGNPHHAVNIVFIEVRQADAVNFSCFHTTLLRLISLLVIGCRVVQQEQVDIV